MNMSEAALCSCCLQTAVFLSRHKEQISGILTDYAWCCDAQDVTVFGEEQLQFFNGV